MRVDATTQIAGSLLSRRTGGLAGMVGRLLCLLGIHDFKVIDATLGFGSGGRNLYGPMSTLQAGRYALQLNAVMAREVRGARGFASAISHQTSTMSRYENYSEASKYYDKTRVPIGGEILIGVLAFSRQSRSEFRLLDAGCGTGAYSEPVLPYVDHIDAIDINPDMLARGAKEVRG